MALVAPQIHRMTASRGWALRALLAVSGPPTFTLRSDMLQNTQSYPQLYPTRLGVRREVDLPRNRQCNVSHYPLPAARDSSADSAHPLPASGSGSERLVGNGALF